MSSSTATARGRVRVRHQAREAAAVMAFSATTSAAIVGVLLLVHLLGR